MLVKRATEGLLVNMGLVDLNLDWDNRIIKIWSWIRTRRLWNKERKYDKEQGDENSNIH